MAWKQHLCERRQRNHGKLGRQRGQRSSSCEPRMKSIGAFQERWRESRRHTDVDGVVIAHLAVINHTQVRQYAASACSACRVKAKVEANHWGIFSGGSVRAGSRLHMKRGTRNHQKAASWCAVTNRTRPAALTVTDRRFIQSYSSSKQKILQIWKMLYVGLSV